MPQHTINFPPRNNILVCPLVVLSIIVSCLSGCVVLPLPSDKSSPALVGHQPRPEELNFITAGVTTRDDLTAKLGMPPVELKGFKILAYPWIALIRNWVVIVPRGGVIAVPQTADNTLFVALGERNQVLKWGFDQRQKSDRFSIVAQARRWAESNELLLPPRQSGITNLALTEGQGAIVLHRITPAISGLGFLGKAQYPESVGVAIDDQFCAELLINEYVVIPVSAGSHQVLVHPVPPYRFWPGHPGWNSFSGIHASTVTLQVSANKTYFLETQATLEIGLEIVTSIVVRDESEARPRLAEGVSIW